MFRYPQKNFKLIMGSIKVGDIVLYHNMKPDVIGDGIEWFTNGKVSHCDLYIGGGNVIGYTRGGCKKMRLDRYYKNHIKIVVRRIKKATIDQKFKMIDEARKDLADKRPYDYLSYAGFIFLNILRKLGWKKAIKKDNPLQGSGKVCSTAIDEWSLRAGLDLFPKVGDETVTPQHIYENDKLITVIEV